MRKRVPIRISSARASLHSAGLAAGLACACAMHGQSPEAAPPLGPVVLDRVVAVVNHHVILTSDLDDEIRLSVLDPNSAGQTLTRQRALEQLVSRALIEQQIRDEDAQAAAPTGVEMDARLSEIRKELPACVRDNCATDEGWKTFLAAHDRSEEHTSELQSL